MDTKQQIWLIRHGETAWSRTGQHTGTSDIPLLAEGEAQAKALAPKLSLQQFALVLASPLQRARRTAALAGLTSVQEEPDLMEWNYGEYDGLTLDEIRRKTPDWTIWTGRVPGGETIDQVAARARRVLDRARQTPGNVALVAHGHVLRVLAACWLGLSPDHGKYLALSPASISVLGYEHTQPVLSMWNATQL